MQTPLQAESPDSHILIVDDQTLSIRVLESILTRAGFRRISHTTDSRKVMELFRESQPELLLLDLQMPHMDGFAVLEQVRSYLPANAYLPILILTAEIEMETKQRALSSGADDFLTKPLDATAVVLRINSLLRTQHIYSQLRQRNVEFEAHERAHTAELDGLQMELLDRLVAVAEYRDDAAEGHNERVGQLSAMLALAIGQPKDEAEMLGRAARLHDLGKIGLPDRVLNKPGKLTGEEFTIMKSHTYIGGQILKMSSFPVLQVAREVAVFHHERWDGTGYLQGHKGETIPLPARIVAIADAFDVMTHRGPAQTPSPVAPVVAEMKTQSGRQFDPYLLRVFLSKVR